MSAQDPTAQWTDHAREQFRTAAAALADALRLHSQALLAMTGQPAEIPVILQAGRQLARLAVAYAQAQFEYTGTFPPLGTAEEEQEDVTVDLADEDGHAPTVTQVTVLHRADYRVTHTAAVEQAGRRAHLDVWPEDTHDSVASDVRNLGRALYQIVHAGGLDALDQTPGLEPVGATTWFLEATQLLSHDPDDWPGDPFALGDDAKSRLLHRLAEISG